MSIKKWSIKNYLKDKKDNSSTLSASHTVMAHEKDINGITVSINNKLIASGSQDRTAKVWLADNMNLMATLKGHKRGIWCVQFSPIDEILATSSADGDIKIWSLSDYSNIATLQVSCKIT